jgi:ribosomal protein S14
MTNRKALPPRKKKPVAGKRRAVKPGRPVPKNFRDLAMAGDFPGLERFHD